MAVADRVNHPDLPLSLFLDSDPSATAGNESPDRDDVPEWSDDERRVARLRRGALVVAAHCIIDDLRHIDFAAAAPPAPDETEDSLVYRFFPVRFRHDYHGDFFRKVLVTAVKAAQDLADPRGGAAACTAEAIIRAAVLATTWDVWDEAASTARQPGCWRSTCWKTSTSSHCSPRRSAASRTIRARTAERTCSNRARTTGSSPSPTPHWCTPTSNRPRPVRWCTTCDTDCRPSTTRRDVRSGS